VCVFFVCIFSLFNIINIVSYIEILSVFNDFSKYSRYVPTKHNKNLSPVTIQKHKHYFVIKNPSSGVASFTGYVSDIIGRRYEKVKNGHIFENWTPI
jgi:5-deoxy-D-glucuronate isomerase